MHRIVVGEEGAYLFGSEPRESCLVLWRDMPEYILMRQHGNGGWVRAQETPFENESVLQELVKDHLGALPLSDLSDRGQPLLTSGALIDWQQAAVTNMVCESAGVP